MDPSLDGVDMISSMPQEILHHILSFIPTQDAIRTSALSKAWRHVWRHTPSLDFDCFERYGRRKLAARDISQTLSLYGAPKITSFHLRIQRDFRENEINSWIEFVVSRNVEKLSLFFDDGCYPNNHVFEKMFYLSSSLTQLCIRNCNMIPGCTVSWESIRKLTLRNCNNLDDESVANILAGSPVLENLRLKCCKGPQRLDLSKSPSLRRLEIFWCTGPTEIVAPHIHYLSLSNSGEQAPSTLVDVSSLAEADISLNRCLYLMPGSLLTMVLKMLPKLQNVKRLTFNGPLLQIISLAELHGVPFPTFKVETLTVKIKFTRYVIPGLARLLHNSPELQKLIADVRFSVGIEDNDLDRYMDSKGLNPDEYCLRSKYEVFPTSLEFCRMMRCKDEMWKLMASFMEMVMRKVKTLETLVVGLEYVVSDARWFEDLLQMLPTLSNNNNVSIMLKR